MKKLTWGLVVVALASCVDRTPSTSLQPSPGDVSNFKADATAFSFTLETARGARRVETIRDGRNILARIEAPDGQKLFELSVEFGAHSVVVTELTDSDRFSVRQSIGPDEIREHYDLNGHTLIVDYPKLDYVTMQKSVALFQRGDSSRIDPRLLQAFLEFEAFYDASNSLHANPDGEALVAALLSPQLADEIGAATATKAGNSTVPVATPGEISVYCAVVGVGTGLKCFFGGGANPICLVGAYHSLACGLIEIVCALWWSC